MIRLRVTIILFYVHALLGRIFFIGRPSLSVKGPTVALSVFKKMFI